MCRIIIGRSIEIMNPKWRTVVTQGDTLQYSCLENPMDGRAWKAEVHAVARSRTRLSDFTFTFHFYALEKEMATQSSILAWRIPGMGEPGGLPSLGSHRVGHDWREILMRKGHNNILFLMLVSIFFIPYITYLTVVYTLFATYDIYIWRQLKGSMIYTK